MILLIVHLIVFFLHLIVLIIIALHCIALHLIVSITIAFDCFHYHCGSSVVVKRAMINVSDELSQKGSELTNLQGRPCWNRKAYKAPPCASLGTSLRLSGCQDDNEEEDDDNKL